MKTVAIIPARYASTRFPGKPLTKIGGVTMIERVYKQAALAKSLSAVIVATDDMRIADAVKSFGGNVVMTRDDHRSGTDRLAEVAQTHPDIDVIVNVQGDEPLIDPHTIDSAVKPLLAESQVQMSTIAAPITDPVEINSPDIVKVVLDSNNFALYFSRSPIPHYRDAAPADRTCLAHVGLYVYRRECLLRLAALPATPLEQAECLEQLRALENGIRIKVVTGKYRSIAVDRPMDVVNVERALVQSTADGTNAVVMR
jgi:3-deoxy-manno-octulosonate cytidylyltransferase (CMP-KDO synthetase)